MDADRPIHRILVCTLCRDPATGLRNGDDVRMQLLTMLKADDDHAASFAVEGILCMAGCDRPLTVGFQAERKAAYLFGGIDPLTDLDALVAFAHQYGALPDGWCSSRQRPRALSGKTLARLPAPDRPTTVLP